MARSLKHHSLISRLFLAQIAPLTAFAVLFLAIGMWTTHRVVERTADRLLAGAMQTILESVTLENGEVIAEVEPWSLALLDNPERDAVFYNVRDSGKLITGYEELPLLSGLSTDHPRFAYLTAHNVPLRMAQQSVAIPGREGVVSVSVAQSLDSRRADMAELHRNLLLFLAMLVGLAALLIWPSLTWGLSALRRLADHLAARPTATPHDFAPTPTDLAPRELLAVISAYNDLLARLERSTSGIQRFAADASHQIRTPLTVIAANLDLLANSDRSWSATELRLLEDSRQSAGYMTRLVHQLLAVARADGVRFAGEADLGRAVRTACRSHSGDDLRLRLPLETVLVRGNEDLIVEQLTNLLDNARRYGLPPIMLQVNVQGDIAQLTLWDHGPGVAPQDLQRLSQRFYRPSATRKPCGAGLGLSIVESLAQAQGGGFSIRNRSTKKGLIVTLSFDIS